MARTKKNVDRSKLEAAIKQAETEQTFNKLGDLWVATAAIYNKSVPENEQITSSVVYLRVGEFKIEFETQAARKGRTAMTDEQKAAMAAARQNRVPRQTRIKGNRHYQASIDAIANQMADNGNARRMASTMRSHAKGSLKAAVRLFCFNCVGGEVREIKTCTSMTCPLWIHRPSQYAWQKDGTDPQQVTVGVS